jgi:hypothetical protein
LLTPSISKAPTKKRLQWRIIDVVALNVVSFVDAWNSVDCVHLLDLIYPKPL